MFGSVGAPSLVVCALGGLAACLGGDGGDEDARAPTGRGGTAQGGTTQGGMNVGGSLTAGTLGASAGDSGHGGASAGAASAGAAGDGGVGGEVAEIGPPEVHAVTPLEGPYGTTVTITGKWLGSRSRPGSALALGDAETLLLEPGAKSGVESWTEDAIVFRYPFPADGAISIETPRGTALADSFSPTWHSAATAASAPTTTVVASLSAAAGSITLLLDTSPPKLLELGPEAQVEHDVSLGSAVLASVKLYLTPAGALEGIAVSGGATPELVRLENVAGDLVAKSTGIALGATEYALAGGPDGAAAWMRRSAGWVRARPGKAGAWAVDAGPVVDPQPNGKNRASGATSDGSLYVAWAIDAGNFVDDMEAPVFRRLGPNDSAFAARRSAGSNVDDYVTSLTLISKGRGLVVRYCGSDVDPSGLSGTAYRCYDALHAQSGGSIARVPVDRSSSSHAFSDARAVAGSCDSKSTYRLRTDTDVQTDPAVAAGEAIVYPCQTAVALEVDPDGDYVPVIRRGALLHLLARRAAP